MNRDKVDRPSAGVSTEALFGEALSGEAATSGSYGRPPGGVRLPDGTALGPVRLQIADLTRSLDYYQQVLGLRRLEQTSTGALLGSPPATPLVELVERPGVSPSPARGRTGLFHFAILLPDRPSLGRFARHLRERGIAAGASDHLVSEALYLQDPDNLGIEVYVDRPRASWRRVGRELMMATDPIDWEALLEAAGEAPWDGVPTGTVMGHVHLHVGDLDAARGFFSEGLGFDLTVWNYPGALFLGAGGYHHHLGTNLWAGPHATAPRSDEAQLLDWTIQLPSGDDVDKVGVNLGESGCDVELAEESATGASLQARDPWGTRFRVRAAEARVT